MSDEFELHKKLFLNYLRIERSLSENTISSYSLDLEKFLSYAENICLINEIGNISEDTVNGFLGYINRAGNKLDEKYSSRSVSRFISSLKSFFRYLITENHISVNPAENFITPKTARILPEVLTIEETDLILSMPDVNDKLGLRDKALMETMYASGLRVSETINLEISNIFFDEGYLRVFGKGSKERIVPIGKTALKFAVRYIDESRR